MSSRWLRNPNADRYRRTEHDNGPAKSGWIHDVSKSTTNVCSDECRDGHYGKEFPSNVTSKSKVPLENSRIR
jgi:hypothetical protein